MMRFVALLVAFALAPARADDAPRAERLDLSGCLERALVAAPDLATAQARVAEREGKLRKARAARILPEFGVRTAVAPSLGATGKLGSTQPDEQVVKTNDLGPWTTVEIGFVQPLWTAGKITAGIEAAVAGVEAQRAASAATAAEVVEQTKTLYYNILLARSIRGVLEEADEAFQKALVGARKRREEGDPRVTELAMLNLRVAAAEVAKDLPRTVQGEASAMDALKRLMGYPPEAQVDITDARLEPPAGGVPALQAYEQQLFEKNPQWKEVTAGLTAKEQELRRAAADYYPQFFLRGGLDYGYAPNRTRQTNPFVFDRFNYLRGPGGALSVGWNLSFHVTAAEVATKRAEMLTVEQERRNAQTGIPLELRTSYRGLVQSQEQLAELEDGRKAGRAILTFAVLNFDLGIGDPEEILQGLGLYTRVSSSYYEALRNYYISRASLARIMGEATPQSVP